MFSVKYKFLAWKDEEIKTVNFDGASISVAEMRSAVAAQTQCDPLDLVFKDHATDDQFPDEGSIPRNSYVIAYRVMTKRTASGAPIRPQRRLLPNVPPPENYVCDRCRGTGHYKANCPTLDNPAYDAGFATPAGIPTSMTVSASLESGTIRLANGTIAALKTHQETLDAVAQQRKLKEEAFASIPEQMRCSISRDLLKEPHLVPCCKSNFCAKCILPDSVNDAVQCPNCYKTIAGDKILPNAQLSQEIEAWKKESGFQDSSSSVSSSSKLPSISSQASTTTAKVERRKPPPRRGAQPAPTASPKEPISPSPDTTVSESSPVLSTSPLPPKIDSSSGQPEGSTGSKETATAIIGESASTQPAAIGQVPLKGTLTETTSSGQHNEPSQAPPKAAPNMSSANLSTSSSTTTTTDTTERKDKSPRTRLREIAALRDAKRRLPESNNTVLATSSSPASRHPSPTATLSGNVPSSSVASSSAMDVTVEPSESQDSRANMTYDRYDRGGDQERYRNRQDNYGRDQRDQSDEDDRRHSRSPREEREFGRRRDDRRGGASRENHDDRAGRDRKVHGRSSRGGDKRGNNRRDGRRQREDQVTSRFEGSREFRGNGSRKYDRPLDEESPSFTLGSERGSNRKRTHDEFSRHSPRHDDSHDDSHARDRDGHEKSRKHREGDTVHVRRRDFDEQASTSRGGVDGRARSPDINH